jgi:hypothetical protein
MPFRIPRPPHATWRPRYTQDFRYLVALEPRKWRMRDDSKSIRTNIVLDTHLV